MKEFLDQFLTESRELVAQATDDLLALEERPDAGDHLDSAFRAFHTLKGAAGIMEFEAMGRALHAAEDVLSAARAGDRPVTPVIVSDCLACLDQVLQWLDDLDASGATPADAAADAIVRRFERDGSAGPAGPPPGDSWRDRLAAKHPAAAAHAALAIRYTPAADSFFRQADPLSELENLPGLSALEIEPTGAWPPLEALDPFTCQLSFLALFSQADPALLARLADLGPEVETVRLEPRRTGGGDALPAAALEVLQAQADLLAATGTDGAAGRTASAGRVAANVLFAAGRAQEAERLLQLSREAATDPRPLADALSAVLGAGPPERAGPARPATAVPETTRSLRVDVERLDAVVNLTGELTVAKNALAHAAALAARGDGEDLAGLLRDQHARLDRLVSELQGAVLNMRVLPLRHVFQRFPRLVREMVVALDRPARLVTEGDATEADKAIVESLFEPLLHVLRNALDHGVESAEERAAAGKPASATIELRARRVGEHVVVEVEDDGRGVDVARVRELAAERGLASAEALSGMADDEVTRLIFAPGFSTARAVTSLSGRGVGMDAVRIAVERLGGRVSIRSERGVGTLVRLTLPFTVMMSRIMTVEAGGQMFGIPMDAVVETVRLPRERIMPVGDAQAFVHRDRTLPLLDLAAALGRPAERAPAGDADIVVAAAGGLAGGLEVDRLGDRMDVMLKPLDGLLAGMRGVAGATLLGDGRVLLVLDVQELLQ